MGSERGDSMAARRDEGRKGPGGRAPRHDPVDTVVLYGWHPVREALANPARQIRRLVATENGLQRLVQAGLALPVTPDIVRPPVIDRLLTPDAVHQGLYLEADPLPAPEFGTLGPQDIVLVLDQVTDPHNVGAILRSAAAFGVRALVTTERHSPAATGVLAKAASGGLEHVPIVHVRNLGDALEAMGRDGVMRVGLDSEGSERLEATPLSGPLALVLGAEDKGLRQRTRGLCDRLARLDMPGAIKSLNVSNAAALALYVAAAELRVSAAPRPAAG
jgi:23S rRNA (guanosine2251-2'-O)-methyltransferase